MTDPDRVFYRRRNVHWWRGVELYLAVGLFWFVVIGVWLALLLGSQSTGTIISHNPVAAVYELFAGHMKWPGNWATALVALEAAFLAVVLAVIRSVLVKRRLDHENPGHQAS